VEAMLEGYRETLEVLRLTSVLTSAAHSGVLPHDRALAAQATAEAETAHVAV